MTGIMNAVKSGESLVHPRPSVSWLVGAVVGVVVLLIAVGVGVWMYGKGKLAVTGSASKMTGVGLEAQASKQLDGFL